MDRKVKTCGKPYVFLPLPKIIFETIYAIITIYSTFNFKVKNNKRYIGGKKVKNFKTIIGYLLVSVLLLANGLLLNSVAWTIKDAYYMNTNIFILLIIWLAIFCLLIAIVSLIVELYRLICKCFKNFSDSRK